MVRSAPWRAGLALALALALTLAALLAACGPGLGGTGTGASQEALAAYGASEVPVCASDLADLLDCPRSGSGPAPALPAPGSRWFAEGTPSSRTLLELNGSDARLDVRCADLVFTGRWGQLGAQAPRYFGHAAGKASDVLATLVVQRNGNVLTLTLVDSLGQVLGGPVDVSSVPGPTDPARCN